MSASAVLFYAAQFSWIFPIITGVIKYRQLPSAGKLFLFFMFFCACTEGIAHLLTLKYHNSMPFLYVFTFVEFAVYSYILLPRLTLFNQRNKLVLTGVLLLMVGLLVTDLFVNGIFRLNTISRITACILIVFMGLAYLLQYITSDSSMRITRDYIFWIAAGAVAYFSIAFFFFAVNNMVVASYPNIYSIISSAHLIATIISYLFFAYGFWVVSPERKDH
jgi:hypothetical protein